MEKNEKVVDRETIIRIIDEQREQAQKDIMCILDGIDDEYLDNVCDVIVDRFNIIKEKLVIGDYSLKKIKKRLGR